MHAKAPQPSDTLHHFLAAVAPAVAPVRIVNRGANAVSLWGERGAATINQPASSAGTPQERRPMYLLDMATLHLAIHVAVSAAPPTSHDAAAHVLAQRADDGRRADITPAVPGTAPGAFLGINPIFQTLPRVKPFTLDSAHACTVAALAENLAHFFGRRQVSFAFDSTVTNTTREWRTVDGIVDECRDARIVGGMHFRHSTLAGEKIGTQVAQRAASRLLPTQPQR